MKNQIKLNNEVSIDLQKLVETKLLIQANSGGGKSWLIRRILEQSHGKIQQIVIDFEGEFHTLREKFDYLLVANGGDVPANIKTAGLLAQEILKIKVPAIIDLYELRPQERKHYVRLFLESMVEAPKSLWHNCLIVIDEAHQVCPQDGDSEALGAVNDLSSKGRKRGFGLVLATQRLGKLDKDSAAECNNKLIGRSSLDIDMERAAKELGFRKRRGDMSNWDMLKILKPGEFFAFGPAVSDQVQQVKIGDVQTSHPKIGSRSFMEVAPPTEKIKQALKRLIDLPQVAEKKLATEKEFREEIARLKRELSVVRLNRKTEHIQMDPKMVERQVQSAVVQYEKEVKSKMQVLADELKKYQNLFSKVEELMKIRRSMFKNPTLTLPEHHLEIKVQPSGVLPPGRMPERVSPSGTRQFITSSAYPQAKGRSKAGEDSLDGDLSGPERRILNAIAWMESIGITEPEQTAVAFLAGYTYGGGAFNNPRSALNTKRLLEYRGDRIALTDQGRSLASIPDQPLTTEELQNKVLEILPRPHQKLLTVLLESYPGDLSREELAEKAGYAMGGAFNNPLSRLRSIGLVKYLGDKKVKAASLLFLE